MSKPGRLFYLDGVRGWAAFMVLLGHLMKGLLVGVTPEYNHAAFNVVTDGQLAVYIFFVLSGFALSVRFLVDGKTKQFSLSELLISRYIRLAIPIFLVSLLAFVILSANLFYNLPAATPAKSVNWLGTFYNFVPTLRGLFDFSFYDVFFRYSSGSSYNSSLWTMPIEFMGSAIIYIFAILMYLPWVQVLGKSRGPLLRACLMVAATLYFSYTKSRLVCFPLGYLIGSFYFDFCLEQETKGSNTARLLKWFGLGSFIFHVLVASFFRPESDLALSFLAAVLVLSVTVCPFVRAFFSTSFSRFLGEISFPLYLMQIVVICSFSSYLFLNLKLADWSDLGRSNLILCLSVAMTVASATAFLPAENFSIKAARAAASLVRRLKKVLRLKMTWV